MEEEKREGVSRVCLELKSLLGQQHVAAASLMMMALVGAESQKAPGSATRCSSANEGTIGSSMGRSHSKHEDGAGAVHDHTGIDTGKTKDPKPQVKPEQNAHTHQGTAQASTSKPVRKSLPHSNHVEVSVEKLGKKKRTVPKIVVSGPSSEQLTTTIDDELPETKTIRDTEDYGPYTVHSRPSTIDAYKSSRGEQ